ncbi:MAG: hypothetical protein HY906_16285 [Deltaproteobacteria bacterium]|nr:hypothetical protein [Deltaproteobacteria bacterium]
MTSLNDADWTVAALARIGQLHLNQLEGLWSIDVAKAPKAPKGISQREFEETFEGGTCCNVSESAWERDLREKGNEAFTRCANLADTARLESDWSALCRDELSEYDPRGYPRFVDIRPQPGHVTARIAAAGPRIPEIR